MPDFPLEMRKQFATTQWSLVVKAGQEARGEALARLLEQYLPALRAHLINGKRLPPDQADDLLQEFTAQKILEKNLFAAADRRLGKFRTFLLTALDRFVLNQHRAQGARKHAADKAAPLADGDDAEYRPDPSRAFDVAWARSVIADALRQMQAECEQSGRVDIWGVFQGRVVAPALEGALPLHYQQMVEQFGFPSPTAASNALVTAKRMYARILRAVVAQYADDPHEVESEIAELRAIVNTGGSR